MAELTVVEKLRDAVAHLQAAAEAMRVADVESPREDRRLAKILAHVEICAEAAQGLHQVLARGLR